MLNDLGSSPPSKENIILKGNFGNIFDFLLCQKTFLFLLAVDLHTIKPGMHLVDLFLLNILPKQHACVRALLYVLFMYNKVRESIFLVIFIEDCYNINCNTFPQFIISDTSPLERF